MKEKRKKQTNLYDILACLFPVLSGKAFSPMKIVENSNFSHFLAKSHGQLKLVVESINIDGLNYVNAAKF